MDAEKPAPQPPLTQHAKATAVEEEIRKLQFRGDRSPERETRSEVLKAAEPQIDDKNSAAIEGCLRTGELMKLLFPQGVQLKNEEEFAAFRLFDRLVGDVAHYAKTGMKGQAALRGISLHAMLLEKMVSSTANPKEP
jgi:hypothetical protein